MSLKKQINEILAEISKTVGILDGQIAYWDSFTTKELPVLGKGRTAGIVQADIFVDYYTCTETLFFRISQFFENSLPKERWHKELLRKMTLDIPGIRNRVVSDRACNLLMEILEFRHFRRYYFKQEYDWDKLDMLGRHLQELHGLLKADLNAFEGFLNQVTSL